MTAANIQTIKSVAKGKKKEMYFKIIIELLIVLIFLIYSQFGTKFGTSSCLLGFPGGSEGRVCL